MILAGVILSPLLGALIVGLFYILELRGFKIKRAVYTFFALLSPLVSFILAVIILITHKNGMEFVGYRWLKVKNFDIYMSFMADHLSLFMVLFVSFVGWLIHIYASGYMSDDEHYGKFFFYFNLFLASMLLLVLGNSPIIMFIGWEGVGVCSYFLISYYYKDNQNVIAGNKAFIVNRIGDAGFIIGMSVLFFYAGENGFTYAYLSANIDQIPLHIKMFIGASLFVGAMAKSAQIPLYVWLPDAMAGPTPVSALIHAATMVTAGIYMVCRFNFLYNEIPNIGLFIAYIGAASSLLAAIIATKQTDIKKILAYSTMSQLGYMFVAVGLANYNAGLFHVFTHAFFKALLFMGAGAVIVALHHEQNIFKMGGLKKELPSIYLVMLVGCLAISGIPPFSGFFSKDEILFSAFARGEYLLWGVEILTAFLTAFYMFRLFFVVFHAKNPQRQKVHKIPFIMLPPLFILAFGASVVGFLGVPLGEDNLIHHFLHIQGVNMQEIGHTKMLLLIALNVLVGLLGIIYAYKRYFAWDFEKEDVKDGVVARRFYVDEIYHLLFVKSLQKLSIFISKVVDIKLIDGAIMGGCKAFVRAGWSAAVLQNANIRMYVLAFAFGVGVISFYLLASIG